MKKHIPILTILLICCLFSSTLIAEKQENEYDDVSTQIDDAEWNYNFTTNGWSINFPANITNYSISWDTQIRNRPLAQVMFTHQYDFQYLESFDYEANGYLEIKQKDHDNWITLKKYSGSSKGIINEKIYVTDWDGQKVTLRFRVEGKGNSVFSEHVGSWDFWDFKFVGIGDWTPPENYLTVSGSMYDSRGGWRNTADHFKFEGKDDFSGIMEFIMVNNNSISGTEVTVTNKPMYFPLKKNGYNNFSFYLVDLCGNICGPLNLTWKVDFQNFPKVEILAPKPGLYLLDKRILPLDKVFIIGDFTVRIKAYDNVSGVWGVRFNLWDVTGITDTEEPYDIKINCTHFGKTKLEIIVEDVAQNIFWERFDVYYYNAGG